MISILQTQKTNRMKNKIAKLLAVFAAFGLVSSAYADDSDCGSCLPEDCATCAPIDIHKHKVYVNPHELDNCKVRFCGKECETKKLTFGGLIQVDYDYTRTDDRSTLTTSTTKVNDPFESGHFQMRRVRLGVDADLGNCWYGRIDLDLRPKCETQCTSETSGNTTLCSSPCGDPATSTSNGQRVNVNACNQSLSNKFFTLNEAYIEKIYEGNSFKFGYKKVNFGAEEGVHAAHLKAIERSIATNYFSGFMGRLPCRPTATCGDSRIGLGNRHVGIFMDGEYHAFGYGLAVTNGFQGLGKSSKFANEIGLYGNAYYSADISGFGLTLGLNVGYQPEGNSNWMRTQGTLIATANQGSGAGTYPVTAQRSSVVGWNPYLNLNWHKFSLMAEILGARVQNGAINVSNTSHNNANPLGYNIIPTYMWDDNWEIVGRYSHLDSDERGVRISNIMPDVNDVLALAPAPATNIFNEVDAFYVGLNYYMKNKAVKFSVGYEHGDFSGRWGSQAKLVSAGGATPVFPNGGDDFGGDKAKVDAVRARLQLVF